MKYFPLFLDLAGKRVAISGAGETAVPKIRLLFKTSARILVYGKKPVPEILDWHSRGKLIHFDREVGSEDLKDCVLLYGADNNHEQDKKVLALGEAHGVLVNIVDNLQLSQFITPAIVDRDPVTIAIGTEGTAPVLARKIKARIEDLLPVSLGRIAKFSTAFRDKVASKLSAVQIRSFWASFFEEMLQKKIRDIPEEKILDNLATSLERYDPDKVGQSVFYFVESGANIPDLLTVKARRLIENADVVFYDQKVSKFILELARREARLIDIDQRKALEGLTRQQIVTTICQEVSRGETILQLGSSSLEMWEALGPELSNLEQLDIKFEFVPGVSPVKAQTVEERSTDLLTVFLDDRARWKDGVNLSSVHHKTILPKGSEEKYPDNLIGDMAISDPTIPMGGN